MLEAVGERYWPRYFDDAARRGLRPGGVAVLQIITIADARFDGYRRGPDFIQRHIFPGGMLPTAAIMRQQIARAGLTLYTPSVRRQLCAHPVPSGGSRFLRAWPEIAALGFDARSAHVGLLPQLLRGRVSRRRHRCRRIQARRLTR